MTDGGSGTTGAGRRGALSRALGRGYYPHQLAWLIDNPVRRLILSPGRLADRLPLKADSRVLELGPGSGYFSVEIARRIPSGRLELLDLQPEMLDKARRKLDARGATNAGYTASDAGTDLPYPDRYFDVALMVAVLGEIPEREACLRQISRVLRPGGVLAVHEHMPDPDLVPFPELRALAERVGYRFQKRWGPDWNFTALFEKPPT